MRRSLFRGWIRFTLPVLLAVILAGAAPVATVAAAGEAGSSGQPAPGFDLPTGLAGSWGPFDPVKSLVEDALAETGLLEAAQLAESVITDLAEGQVPVISNLVDPFEGNVKTVLAEALEGAKVASDMLSLVGGPEAQAALAFLMENPLLPDSELAFTLPTGRVRLYKEGQEIGLCITTIGPAGGRITSGISNAEGLCGVTAPRLANPDKSLVSFTDMALGYTHIQSRHVLAPGLTATPHPSPVPTISGETYVKINGQWVQIRLAGPDPESVTVEASFDVGIKGEFNYVVMGNVGGTAALGVEVNILDAVEVIESTTQAMVNEAQAQGITLEEQSNPDAVAAVLKKGLQHLQQVSTEKPEALGEATLTTGVSGNLGVGIWDTGLAGGSADASMSVSAPLLAMANLPIDALSELLLFGMGMGEATNELSISILEGNGEAEVTALATQASAIGEKLVTDTLTGLLAASTNIGMSLDFGVGVLGEQSSSGGSEAAATNIPVLETSLAIPIGDLSATLQSDPGAIGRAVEAAARIMLLAVGQGGSPIPDGETGTVPTTGADVWRTLSLGMVDGIELTFMSMGLPLTMTGIKDVALGDMLDLIDEQAEAITPILAGLMSSARSGSLTDLRSAIEAAIVAAGNQAAVSFLNTMQTLYVPFSAGFGANFDVGAEAKGTVGFGGNLSGEVKASLLLLMLGSPAYAEADQTELARITVPVTFTLGAGANLSEGVEVEGSGSGTVGVNLLELTFRHWDGELPPPATMTVAGFEVMEFDGEIRGDDSMTGSGFLLLPIGGLVAADFDVDAQGNVLSGSWEGGFDLGPMGKIPLATGKLDNDGIHGHITLPIFDSTLTGDYILSSSARLFGTYGGTLTIAGHDLSDVEIYLGPDGSYFGSATVDAGISTVTLDLRYHSDGRFTGSYTGDLEIAGQTLSDVTLTLDENGFRGESSYDVLGNTARLELNIAPGGIVTGTYKSSTDLLGFATELDLTLTEDGLRGNALIDLLGSQLTATDFAIDSSGRVSATFTGGLTIAGHQASDVTMILDGSTFTGGGSFDLLGNTADFSLAAADGKVTGIYQQGSGEVFGIAGFGLKDVRLTLDDQTGFQGTGKLQVPGLGLLNLQNFGIAPDGQVTGNYQGNTNLFGFATSLDLDLSADGFTGNGSLSVLGSDLQATNLTIDSSGNFTGIFTGQLSVGGHSLSGIALDVQNDRLVGTAKLDLPGVSGAQVTITLQNGQVTATFANQIDLFGYSASELNLTFLSNQVLINGQMASDLLGFLNTNIAGEINDAAQDAAAELNAARDEIEHWKSEVNKLNGPIEDMRAQVKRERELAMAAVKEAEKLANEALAAFNAVADQVASLQAEFSNALRTAEGALSSARSTVNSARSILHSIQREINSLDDWYDDLHWIKKGLRAADYGARKGSLELAKKAAEGALWTAEKVLSAAESALNAIGDEMDDKLAPLLNDKNAREVALGAVSGVLADARGALNDLPINPDWDPRVAVLIGARETANGALTLAQTSLVGLEATLGGLADVATFINDLGLTALFNVHSAGFQTDLDSLANSQIVLNMDLTFMNEPKQISFLFDLLDPVGSAKRLMDALLQGGGVTPVYDENTPNVPPTVMAGSDGVNFVMQPFQRNGAFTDPGSDSWTAMVNYGDGNGLQPLALNGSQNFTLSHTYTSPGSFPVQVQVTDDKGAIGTTTFTVTVPNVPPTVTVGSYATVAEGSLFSQTGSYTDAGAGPSTATVDYGDGTGVTTLALGPNKSIGLSHIYADNGTYSVTVMVTDVAGDSATGAMAVTVQNEAPTLDAGSDRSADEGDRVSLSAAFHDPGTLDTHTATVDWGDDTGAQPADVTESPFGPPGDSNGANGTLSASHVYADSGTYTVTVSVTDKDGAVATDTLTMTVANVAPTVNAGLDQTANEGDVVTLDPATFHDQGTADLHTAMIDWGDGSEPEPATITQSQFGPPGSVDGQDGTIAAAHVYATEGTYTVTLTVTDHDGGAGTDSLAVTIHNLPPTVNAGPDQTVNEGDLVSLSPATFNDMGTLDTHTATVDWGDGTGPQAATVTESPFGPPGSELGKDGEVSASHVYAKNDTYTVTICVTDDADATTCDDLTMTVQNVAPTVNVGADQTVKEGHIASLAPATFNDKGTLDTHTATVDWGDGTGPQSADVSESPFGPPGSTDGADGTVSASHVYATDGTYTVTVCVTDDVGATTCDDLTMTVPNVPPTLVAGPDQTVNEGDLVHLTPSNFHDMGTLDTHTATVDWGDTTGRQTATVTQSPFGPPGSTDGQKGTIDANHVYAHEGTYTVTVCVDDGQGEVCDSLMVTVNNVPPTVDAGPDQTVLEGDLVLLAPATFHDMGTLDRHTATVDWGDTTGPQPATVTQSPFGPPGSTDGQNGTVSSNHVYAQDGTYTVTVCVSDDFGDTTCDSLTMAVQNVAPTISIDTIWDELGNVLGLEVDFILRRLRLDMASSFHDQGTLDVHTATANWGDSIVTNSAVTQSPFGPPGSVSGQDGTIADAHDYATSGFFTITQMVDDGRGGQTPVSRQIEVKDASGATTAVTGMLQALAAQPGLDPVAAEALTEAMKQLSGASAQSRNSALSQMAEGNWASALQKIRNAQEELLTAGSADGSLSLSRAQQLLALSAKSAVVVLIDSAELVTGAPGDPTKTANARDLVTAGDSLLAAGDYLGAVDRYREASQVIQGVTRSSTDEGPGQNPDKGAGKGKK